MWKTERIKVETEWIKIGLLAGFLVCTGDFIVSSILGLLYPGYNWLYDSMSALGNSESPFESAMAVWGVAFTILFFLFGRAFRGFAPNDRSVRIISWLITMYGFGEGVGSGFFPFDRIGQQLTTDAVIHRISGIVGILCLFVIPILMLRFFRDRAQVMFYRYSIIVSVLGIVLLFLFRTSSHYTPEVSFLAHRGLWQRLFLVNYYFYLCSLAVILYRQKHSARDQS